jgi:hypothetical protein
MKAVGWQGKERVHLDDVPDSKILNSRDGVVQDHCVKVALKQ